jgi:hypothetical protein
MTCLLSRSFGIYFKNLAFEIYVPLKNESKFRLLSNNSQSQIGLNQMIIDRTDRVKENSRENLPMMGIDTKNRSMILIEQGNDFSQIQTANVTVIFNHQVSFVWIFYDLTSTHREKTMNKGESPTKNSNLSREESRTFF